MLRMREVAASSPLKVFAYNPVFVLYEQYVGLREATLKNIGVTAAGT